MPRTLFIFLQFTVSYCNCNCTDCWILPCTRVHYAHTASALYRRIAELYFHYS